MLNPKILYDHYFMKEYTIKEIAEKFGVTFYQIHSQLAKCGIPRRLKLSDDPHRRTRPWKGKYFLQKIDGFYYPLKGGELKMKYLIETKIKVATVIATTSQEEAKNAVSKMIAEVVKSVSAPQTRFEAPNWDFDYIVTELPADEPTAEELTDEQLQHESEQ